MSSAYCIYLKSYIFIHDNFILIISVANKDAEIISFYLRAVLSVTCMNSRKIHITMRANI